VVDWPTVLATYESMTGIARQAESASTVRSTDEKMSPPRTLGSVLRRLFVEDIPSGDGPTAHARTHSTVEIRPADPTIPRSQGDVLCSLGAPWHDENYKQRVVRFIKPAGVGFALLVHDLIPLLCPEFFEHGRAPNFAKFMREMLPLADNILTNSRATASDVLRWSTREGLTLRAQPRALPIGTGFARPPAGPLPPDLEPGSFVLFVSTLEIRKNHLQAFRVWCRLLQDLPRDAVPTLVFAGSPGWMVADLLKAIESTNRLDGKLMIITGPDDATLCALYRACRFTLFLSYYEGWGLPVSDSLSFGKVCVASNRTSLPEAGGMSCVYVDPDNTTGAYSTIRRLIEDPAAIPELERRLADCFVPVPWSASANALLQALFPAGQRRVADPALA
jgi:glycosyltransferase involved in cell wall biosynthesis